MTSEPTTLLHRAEQQGRRYPLFVERLLLAIKALKADQIVSIGDQI